MTRMAAPTMVSQGCRKFQVNVLSLIFCTQSVMSFFPSFFFLTLVITVAFSKGITQAAMARLTSRLMVMVMGKNPMTSPASPVRVNRIGKKMAQMQIVAKNIGQKYCTTLCMAASFLLYPLLRYSMYPSITTMELSTIIPSTTIRLASVIMLSSIPAAYMIPVEMNVERGMVIAATTAERSGKSMTITNIMISMDNIRSRKKSCTEMATTSGWSVMRLIWTSSGR